MKIPNIEKTREIVQRSPYDMYFLSNLYQENAVTHSVKDFNHFYSTDMYGEEVAQRNRVQTGDSNIFKIDNDVNFKYNIQPGSYSAEVPINMIPWYSEVSFIDKYKYGTPISSLDVMKDAEVFNKTIFFFMGDYLIYEVFYVMKKSTMIIFLVESNHMKADDLRQLVSNSSEWTLLYTSKGMYYTAYNTRNVLITKGNRLYIKNLKRGPLRHSQENSKWSLYINDSLSSPNKMTCTHTTLCVDENGESYFELSEEYKNFIFDRTPTMKCLVVNEPDCTGTGVYVARDGISPIFQLPYNRVPAPETNLLLWEYDATTGWKKHPLVANVSLSYPNIYDFTRVLFTDGLYIEWIEPDLIPRKTIPLFKDYMDYRGSEFSHDILSGSAPSVVSNYIPADPIYVNNENYPESLYFGDYRLWKLHQLVYMMKDIPLRYRTLFRRIYREMVRYISSTYTKEKYPEIFERSILDNNDHCDGDDERATTFSTPHTYIKVNNTSCRYRHCTLFIDGIRKVPTYNMTYGGYMYVYFPKEWITDESHIQLDVGLVSDIIKSDDNKFSFLFNTSEHRCMNDTFTRKHSFSDILFYSGKTNEILHDKFDIGINISIYDIRYKDREITDNISFLDSEAEVFVKDTLRIKDIVFSPLEDSFLIVRRNGIDYPLTDYSSHSHKDFDLRNVVIKNPSEEIVGQTLHMATTDFYTSYLFDFSSSNTGMGNIELWEKGPWDESKHEYGPSPYYVVKDKLMIVNGKSVTLKLFKGAHSKDHFRIFVDGILQNPNLYSITFSDVYNGECTINMNEIPFGYTIIDYLPYEETVVYNGPVIDLKKTGDNILYLRDYMQGVAFDTCLHRVYIDGLRICEDDIAVLGSGTSIAIRMSKYNITDESTMVIFQQALDLNMNPYDFSVDAAESGWYDTALMEGGSAFRQWVVDKYLS